MVLITCYIQNVSLSIKKWNYLFFFFPLMKQQKHTDNIEKFTSTVGWKTRAINHKWNCTEYENEKFFKYFALTIMLIALNSAAQIKEKKRRNEYTNASHNNCRIHKLLDFFGFFFAWIFLLRRLWMGASRVNYFGLL